MNLKTALKSKKKLIKEINTHYQRFQQFNSISPDETPAYDPKEEYELWFIKTKELIDLKNQINKANMPIFRDIIELGELKNIISNLRNINTNTKEKLSYIDNTMIDKIVFMDLRKKDDVIELMESNINTIQERIEEFNAITKI